MEFFEIMKHKSIDHQFHATKSLYCERHDCRLCHSHDLVEYLDLGFTSPADQFRLPQELCLPEVSYPLKVMFCQKCGFSQLSHVVDPRVLYQHDYPYESSTTKTGQTHWDEFARLVVKRLNLKQKSLVVDIGSNVGVLLQSFKKLGMDIYGVDPAPNIVKIANEKFKIRTICDFFGRAAAKQILKKAGKATVITGSNVFAHIDDLDGLMKAVVALLHKKGVFIFESPHFLNLVKNLEYDTIYHEHLSYLSLKPLIPFFKRFGLAPFAVEVSKIHGGSFRVYVGRINQWKIDPSIKKIIDKENKSGIHNLAVLKKFARRVYQNREDLVWLVENILHQGKKIAVVSTPAKGMTLLNFCGLINRHFIYATEKTALKIGRVTPGGHIPIVPDGRLLKDRPDYALLLAWNFAEEIMKNLAEFRRRGGKFIIPVPKPKII